MRAENEIIEQKQQEKQKALYKQELAWMRAGAKARTTKQQARINRFNDLESEVQDQHVQDKGQLNLAYSRLGKQVYELEKQNKLTAEHYLKILLKLFKVGNVLVLLGQMELEKTTLLNILSGEDNDYTGTLKIGQTVKVAYF